MFISLFGYLPKIVSLSDCTNPICNILASTERFLQDLTPAISWFMNISLKALLNFEDATTTLQSRAELQPKFKDCLKRKYDQPNNGMLFNMAMGTCLTHSIVVASHIFQYKWWDKLL